jgi:fructose-specific phosphotransferase system IIC component
MFIAILFASGFLPGLVVASILRHVRGRLALAAVGIVTWIAYAIYIEEFAPCPAQGECDKAIGVLFLAVVLIGWLGGIAASWIARRPRSHRTQRGSRSAL